MDFVDISYENASFNILEESIWLKPIYFLTTVAFWLMKYLFLIDGDILRVLAKNLTLCRIYRSNHGSWKIHGTASINFDCFTIDESYHVKSSSEMMQCQGYFLKLLWGRGCVGWRAIFFYKQQQKSY